MQTHIHFLVQKDIFAFLPDLPPEAAPVFKLVSGQCACPAFWL